MLLRTLIWPRYIDNQKYHRSDQWLTIRGNYQARHPRMRCRVCGAGTTGRWALMSWERTGWSGRIGFFTRTRGAHNPLHELAYPPKGKHTPDWLLMPLCRAHHTGDARRGILGVHGFDWYWLPWDHRNRLLWLTTWWYVLGMWSRYLPVAAAIAWSMSYRDIAVWSLVPFAAFYGPVWWAKHSRRRR